MGAYVAWFVRHQAGRSSRTFTAFPQPTSLQSLLKCSFILLLSCLFTLIIHSFSFFIKYSRVLRLSQLFNLSSHQVLSPYSPHLSHYFISYLPCLNEVLDCLVHSPLFQILQKLTFSSSIFVSGFGHIFRNTGNF